jgi:hypothetical protein
MGKISKSAKRENGLNLFLKGVQYESKTNQYPKITPK